MRMDQGLRLYEIALSQDDVDEICSGFPEAPFLIGMHGPTCARFEIHDGVRMSESWEAAPDDTYIFNFGGVEAPIPPSGVSPEEFDRLSEIFYTRIEDALSNLGRLPMVMDYGGLLGRRTIGYVEMSVAEK